MQYGITTFCIVGEDRVDLKKRNILNEKKGAHKNIVLCEVEVPSQIVLNISPELR